MTALHVKHRKFEKKCNHGGTLATSCLMAICTLALVGSFIKSYSNQKYSPTNKPVCSTYLVDQCQWHFASLTDRFSLLFVFVNSLVLFISLLVQVYMR